MKIEEYNNWPEVISSDDFYALINELIIKQNEFDKVDTLKIISILSEKYMLFYGTCELTDFQRNGIYIILVSLTDFSSLEIIRELLGILFNFRIESYYSFLKMNNYQYVQNDVINEIVEALNEYKMVNKRNG